MIYKTIDLPRNASIGDAWVGPRNDFKRVLSRGGAWENVNIGAKHPDEVDHEQSTQPETEQRNDSSEVPSRPGESAPGDGDDGQTVSESSGVEQENPGVIEPAGHEANVDVSPSGEPLTSTGPIEGGVEGEGVDRKDPPVV